MTTQGAVAALQQLNPDDRARLIRRLAELARIDQLVRERPVTSGNQGGRR